MIFHHKPHCLVSFIILAIGLVIVDETYGREKVSVTRLEVPPHVHLHDDVEMICEHNIRPGHLNYVYWMHNDVNFYRYEADDKTDPKVIYNDTGLLVDVKRSSDTKVVLRNVNFNASGKYKCEVRSEAPDFLTDSKEAEMVVVVIPNEKPLIEPPPDDGLRIGSDVEFNCTASPSYPAPTLSWEVNGEKVPDSYLKHYQKTQNKEGLYINKLGLRFKVKREHFVNSELKLKCIARVTSLSNEIEEHSHQESTNSGQGEPPAQPAIEGNLIKANGLGVRVGCGWNLAVAMVMTLFLYR